MKKIVFLLLFIVCTGYSCALCTIYSPKTLASINVQADNKTIQSISVILKLTEEFTTQLKDLYDMNANGKIDRDELDKVQTIFEDYAKPKRYFLTVSYDKIIRKETFNQIKVENFESYIENNILHFKYTAHLNYKLYNDYFLNIKIDDNENFFLLSLNENSILFNGKNVKKNLNDNSVVFSTNEIDILNPQEIKSLKQSTSNDSIKKSDANIQSNYLLLFSNKIKSYLSSIKNGDIWSLWSLLLISLGYGMIHAIGPGHGKALAFSYFSVNKSTTLKAFFISQASAFIHIIGALVLVVISVFILQSFLNNFVNDSVVILTKISAMMIVMLSLYLLSNKFRQKDCSCSSCCTKPTAQAKPKWSTQSPNSNLLQVKSKEYSKQDLYFVLTAGLIPCPGTVILFIYAFVLKTYFAVLLASIFISLGMGIIIFITSYLGIGVNKLSEKSHKIGTVLNIVSPLIMLLLGLLLFFNANVL